MVEDEVRWWDDQRHESESEEVGPVEDVHCQEHDYGVETEREQGEPLRRLTLPDLRPHVTAWRLPPDVARVREPEA